MIYQGLELLGHILGLGTSKRLSRVGDCEWSLPDVFCKDTPHRFYNTTWNLVPRACSSFKIVDRRNPWARLPKWLQKFVRILTRKHDEMFSICLNNGFRLQKTNRAARHGKQPPRKRFPHVLRDKILHDSWSVSLIRHFERGEGSGDEVARHRECQVSVDVIVQFRVQQDC